MSAQPGRGAQEAPGPLSTMAGRIEAVLFAAGEPVAPARLAAAAGVTEGEAERAVAELERHLAATGHGIELRRVAGGVQLLTRPEYAAAVASVVRASRQPLSRAALETLAIVAYRQPVSRPAIDEVRGVRSAGALQTLVERGLVREAGRAEAPGRPVLYGTTRRFLAHFGLNDLSELPPADGVAAGLDDAPPLHQLPPDA